MQVIAPSSSSSCTALIAHTQYPHILSRTLAKCDASGSSSPRPIPTRFRRVASVVGMHVFAQVVIDIGDVADPFLQLCKAVIDVG